MNKQISLDREGGQSYDADEEVKYVAASCL